jgi:hypothetical protein
VPDAGGDDELPGVGDGPQGFEDACAAGAVESGVGVVDDDGGGAGGGGAGDGESRAFEAREETDRVAGVDVDRQPVEPGVEVRAGGETGISGSTAVGSPLPFMGTMVTFRACAVHGFRKLGGGATRLGACPM